MKKFKGLVLNHPDTIYLLYLFAIFFLAQLVYHLLHAGFFSNFFGVDLMMVDMHAILAAKGHFWQSMFYYTLSPPLYALYASGFNLLFPPQGEIGFYLLHTVLGLYAVYCLYKTQRKLDIHPVLATLLISIFVLSPGFNFTETTGFYDFPVACLLIISVWWLVKLLENPSFYSAFGFFMMVGLVCSIRSLYHVLLYLLPVIAITTLLLKKHWKVILLGSLIPFLFVFSVYLKNYILFDMFSTTSYLGETLDSIVMQFNVSLAQREAGIQQGFFSDLALCPSTPDSIQGTTPNSKLGGWYCYTTFVNKYRAAYINKLGTDYKNVPLLSCTPASTNQPGLFMPHRSCLGNIGMSEEYKKNALAAIIHYPGSYWRGIRAALRQYCNTHVSYYYDIMGRSLPKTLSISWLRMPLMQLPNANSPVSFPLIIAFPLLLFFAICYLLYAPSATYGLLALYSLGLWYTLPPFKILPIVLTNLGLIEELILKLLNVFLVMLLMTLALRVYLYFKPKLSHYFLDSTPNNQQRVIVFYLLGNIIFTSVIIILCVGVGQQRYRFYVDGLYLMLLGLFIKRIVLPAVGWVWERRKPFETPATRPSQGDRFIY